MKILDAKVNWFAEFDNDPVIQLLVDQIPDVVDLVYRRVRVSALSDLYYAERGGYVRFLYHDKTSERGFGGDTFRLKVKGEGVVSIKGPWSSRAGVVNALQLGPCMDVDLTTDPEAFERGHTFRSGSIKLSSKRTIQICKLAGIYLESVFSGDGELKYVPRKPTPLAFQLPREEALLLNARNALIKHEDTQAAKPIERYFHKYYGAKWEETLN